MQANSEILVLYKNLGETPLECLDRLRLERPEYEKANMTYLGRLDPMAEGVMPVLVGDTREKEKYLAWDKTYEFEVLWGFETDTYDILGLVTVGKVPQKLEEKISALMRKIAKRTIQSYPPYSSRAIGGKQLFQWAREGRIREIDIPERQIKIFSLDHIHTREMLGKEILKEVTEKISLVKGDFRQKEILKKWNAELKNREGDRFMVSRFTTDVSSGTYVRGLAHEMGKLLDSSALAYSIKRTRVGEYRLESGI